MKKTLAMKVLEGAGAAYEPVTYPPTERDAAVLARHFGVPPEQVFKTLVVDRPPQKPLLVLVSAAQRLNLKKLAKAVGDKKLSLATHQAAEKLTGLQVGGISPLALLNKGFVIYADRSIEGQERVFVSAGQKGLNLKVGVADLLAITRARLVEVGDGV